jgi:ribosomal protein S18 acetylase RimI-like enzyme
VAVELVEPLRPPRILDLSERQKQLKAFRCGRRGRPWEVTVNDWVKDLYRGCTTLPQTVIALEDAIRQPVGLVSVTPRDLQLASGELLPGRPYIHMLGVHHRFHRRGIGGQLLTIVLEEIGQRWPGESAFPVWAYVHPGNEESHRLFAKYGFDRQEPAIEGHEPMRVLHRA